MSAPATYGLVGGRPPSCPFGAHRRGGGLDESARRLSHSELAVAELLAAEGHRVVSLPESRRGPCADLEVCGGRVEVKAYDLTLGRARPPGALSVCNKLTRATEQAPVVVLWAKGSGLEPVDARRGVALFAQRHPDRRPSAIRVIGDGFDLAWAPRAPDLGLRPPPGPPPLEL